MNVNWVFSNANRDHYLADSCENENKAANFRLAVYELTCYNAKVPPPQLRVIYLNRLHVAPCPQTALIDLSRKN